MSGVDESTELATELIFEETKEDEGKGPRWHRQVALSFLLMALLAGITAREEAIVQSVSSSHLIFAIAVTILSVGVAMSGMSVVVDQRLLWVVGLVFGAIGTFGIGIGIVTMV